MKRMKKIFMMFLAVVLIAGGTAIPSLTAYAAATAAFSVSGGGNATQGGTVSVTVSVNGSDIMSYAKVSVNYDASVLEYQSGADSGGSGRVSILFDCGEGAKSASRTLTFKAKAVGNATVSMDTAEATTMGSATVMPEMMSVSVGGSAGVTVSAPVQASADAHIGWMEISPGTLNPAFSKDVFKYSVEVENNVKKVTVSALAAHEKGIISSVKGGNNLKVGQNTITVTCKAENGSTAVYTIVVTRKEGEAEKEPETTTEQVQPETQTPAETVPININGADWYISQDFKTSDIPEGFEEAVTTYQGTEYKAVRFSKNDLYLLYLTDAEKKNGTFFVYYPDKGTIEEMVKLSFMEGTYLIILSPEQYDGVPEMLTETQFAIEDRNLRGWQFLKEALEAGESGGNDLTLERISADTGAFYFVYGMNQEGNLGWYTIDTQENTIQRFALFADKPEESEETFSVNAEPVAELTQMEKKVELFQFCILGMSAVMLILIVVTLILAVKCRKKAEEEAEEETEEETEKEEFSEPEKAEENSSGVVENTPEKNAERQEIIEKLEKLSHQEPSAEDEEFGLEFIDLDDM